MSKKLKVLMILGGFPSPQYPYKCIFNLRAAKQLSQFVDIEVVSMRMWLPGRKRISSYEYEGIKVYTLTAPQIPGYPALNLSLYEKFGWPYIRPLIQKSDLVHSVYADGPGVMSALWTLRCRKPHVMHIIGSDVYDGLKNNPKVREYKQWYKHISGGIAVSQAIADEFARLIPAAVPVQPVYRGTDLALFNPDGNRIEFADNSKGVRFLFMCGFPPANSPKDDLARKGGKNILRAWKNCEHELKTLDASLILAGPNSQQDEIVKFIDGLKFRDNIHICGPLHPKQVPDYMRSTDVVLVPHLEVGLPNVAQEALASGKAVLGSDVGGMKEILEDGVNGLVLPLSTDSVAWGEAMVKMAGNFELVRKMGAEGRKKAELLLDKNNFAPKVFAIYRQVMENFSNQAELCAE